MSDSNKGEKALAQNLALHYLTMQYLSGNTPAVSPQQFYSEFEKVLPQFLDFVKPSKADGFDIDPLCS